jgi:hypothetical protein
MKNQLVKSSGRALCLALAAYAAVVLFGTGTASAAQRNDRNDKVTICHNGRTITVAPSAVPAP